MKPSRLAVLVILAVVASCQSILGPDKPKEHPLVGSYALSTSLVQFSFETPGTHPDCPGSTSYCTHLREFSGAILNGDLTITVNQSNNSPVGSGEFGGMFCGTVDPESGCTSLAFRPLVSYVGTYTTLQALTDSTFTLAVQSTVDGPSRNATIYLSGRVTDDGLAGIVRWAANNHTRSPPAHIGTFVATRR